MNLVPMEPRWVSDAALELFNGLVAERDRVIAQMQSDMGLTDPAEPETATALAARTSARMSPKRQHEIALSYQPILDALNRKIAYVVGEYTVPQAMMVRDEATNG